MAFSVVVFPAPFAPTSATISPGCDVEADVPERGHLPVRHLQSLDVQHHATRFPK